MSNDNADGSPAASSQVYMLLRKDILEGQVELGQRLVETELAETYNTSRTPIREALRQLESDGLVTYGRGARVCSYTEEDLVEIYSIREVLEGYAARLATPRISDKDLERLLEICNDMESVHPEDSDIPTIRFLVAKNNEFHAIIWQAAANDRLMKHIIKVAVLPMAFKTYFWHTHDERARSMSYHRELIAAFHARSERRAEALMQSHVNAALSYLLLVWQRDNAKRNQ